ncbi:hypothetical protein BIV57_08310 [Mangrovactinospora gilvigrisea]|uniref:TerD domain-containing protein n=1 Tax=Mangrovactinospora gilvigrisea TaxID=1428644 RepID=A0A1J7CE55_9ACTN|nr:TerD family protein [Mangrovactinospora gilvigrisea]OIV37954.1 hypothetical protein BIV57_08310 [Mangrovactinospora gilvigrisea]
MSLHKGGNTVVPATELRVALGWRKGPATPGADALAVLLSGRRARSLGEVVSSRAPRMEDGGGRPVRAAVRYEGRESPGNGERELFSVDLTAVPADVDRVLFALRSEGAGFGAFAGLCAVISEAADGHGVARYDCSDASTETVLILGELYRRADEWKFRAVGQGYAAGLAALAEDIELDAELLEATHGLAAEPEERRGRLPRQEGAVVLHGSAAALSRRAGSGSNGAALPRGSGSGAGAGSANGGSSLVPAPGYGYLPWTADRYLPSAGPSLGRQPAASGEQPQVIVLTQSVPGISLAKHGATRGTLRINLNWSMLRRPRAQPQGGFLQWLFGGEPREPELDLDLCCLWELQDGRKGVIQPTGNRFGALHRPPYVRLDKDDRTGATEDGENLDINLDHSADFRRLLVFSVIYEGASGYGGMDAAGTLYPPYGQPIEVRLDQTDELTRMCAIALIENVGGELVVHREAKYIPGNEADVDRAYGWGLRWSRGYK